KALLVPRPAQRQARSILPRESRNSNVIACPLLAQRLNAIAVDSPWPTPSGRYRTHRRDKDYADLDVDSARFLIGFADGFRTGLFLAGRSSSPSALRLRGLVFFPTTGSSGKSTSPETGTRSGSSSSGSGAS